MNPQPPLQMMPRHILIEDFLFPEPWDVEVVWMCVAERPQRGQRGYRRGSLPERHHYPISFTRPSSSAW